MVLVAAVVGVRLGLGGPGRRQGHPGGHATSPPPPRGQPPTPAAPPVGTTQLVDGTRFTLQAVADDSTCVGHAYGEIAAFFATTDCTGLSRALYSAQVDGGPAVVSVARVRMPDTARARDLRALTDANGSGNVSDLLREGVRYPVPGGAVGAEYASGTVGRRRAGRGELLGRRRCGRRDGQLADDGVELDHRPTRAARRLRPPGSWAAALRRSRRPRPSRSAGLIAGAGSRPALCGVELISPKTACARARQRRSGRGQPGQHRHPHLDVAALQPADLGGSVGERAEVAVLDRDQAGLSSAKSTWKAISPASWAAGSSPASAHLLAAGEQSLADPQQHLGQHRVLAREVPVDGRPVTPTAAPTSSTPTLREPRSANSWAAACRICSRRDGRAASACRALSRSAVIAPMLARDVNRRSPDAGPDVNGG